MEELIAKLRAKPKRYRQGISFAVAGFFTLIILFIWYRNFHMPAAPVSATDSVPAAATTTNSSASN